MRRMILAFLLCLLFCEGPIQAADDELPPSFKKVSSPNGRLAVRLRSGQTIGNASFDRAELIEKRHGNVIYQFKGTDGEESEGAGGYGGGFGWFDKPPVIWSGDSRYVALMCHDHRTGETKAVKVTKSGVRVCTIPDVIVPRIEKEFESGRQWQTWLRPVKWTTADVLVAEYSGTIRNYGKPKNGNGGVAVFGSG